MQIRKMRINLSVNTLTYRAQDMDNPAISNSPLPELIENLLNMSIVGRSEYYFVVK